jgi:hypothetical protein
MERVTSHPIANASQSLKFFSPEDRGLAHFYDILTNHSLKKDLLSNAIFSPCTLLLDNTFIYVYSKNIQKQATYGEQAIVSILLSYLLHCCKGFEHGNIHRRSIELGDMK